MSRGGRRAGVHGSAAAEAIRPYGVGMTPFAALHHSAEPLLLPNAWDHASARALAARGFPAIGTTSLAVAAAVGLPDGAARTRDETLRLARVLGGGPFLLSVDAEGGFSDDPDEVAEFARRLAAAGAVGINLEDGLGPAARHAAKIAAVKSAVPGLFVNARTDTYWLGAAAAGPLTAGARTSGPSPVSTPTSRRAPTACSCPGSPTRPGSPPWCATSTSRSTSSTHPPAPALAHLTDLGVRRVSLGSLLYRQALGAALEAVTDVRAAGHPAAPRRRTPTCRRSATPSGGTGAGRRHRVTCRASTARCQDAPTSRGRRRRRRPPARGSRGNCRAVGGLRR
ncbi:hypothetical protein GCM10020295_17160 [Streptomyces cinereospinus]